MAQTMPALPNSFPYNEMSSSPPTRWDNATRRNIVLPMNHVKKSPSGNGPRPAPGAHFGTILRRWRAARRMSQLALALEAGISMRHLSYIETGRAAPSREMVVRLSEALQIPLRERNGLLVA